ETIVAPRRFVRGSGTGAGVRAEAAGEVASPAGSADALFDRATQRRAEHVGSKGPRAMHDERADADVDAAHAKLRGLASASGRSSLAASGSAASRRCGMVVGSAAA